MGTNGFLEVEVYWKQNSMQEVGMTGNDRDFGIPGLKNET